MTANIFAGDVPLRRIGIGMVPVAVATAVAVAAGTDRLSLLLAGAALLVLLVVGLRSPVLVLGLLVALVPIEEVLAFGEAGRTMADTLHRPRLSYNVAVYHRTLE